MEAYLESVNWPSVAHPLDPILETEIRNCIEKCAGWCKPEKALKLARLIVENKPERIVEVGVFGGKSLLPMALAARYVRNGVVYGIDPWDKPSALEGDVGKENADWWSKINLEEVYTGFAHLVLTLRLTWECRWLRMRSEDAVRIFDDESVDLFHQDGNHSEQVSCRDVKLWGPKLSPKAIWVMDDTDWPTQARAIKLIGEMGFGTVVDSGTYMVFQRQ